MLSKHNWIFSYIYFEIENDVPQIEMSNEKRQKTFILNPSQNNVSTEGWRELR